MTYLFATAFIFMVLIVVLSKSCNRLEHLLCASTVFAVLFGGFGFGLEQIGAISEYYSPFDRAAIACAIIAVMTVIVEKVRSAQQATSSH